MITGLGQPENEERHSNIKEKWESNAILMGNAEVSTYAAANPLHAGLV